LIRPNNVEEIDETFLAENNINSNILQSSESLSDSLDRFIKLVKENFVARDFMIGFLAKDNWLINEYLYNDCKIKGVEFPEIFNKNMSLVSEFKNFYKLDAINEKEEVNVNDLLVHLALKETESSTPSLKILNTIARIVNRMIKDGYVFKASTFNTIKRQNNTFNINIAENKNKTYYLRFKNIPTYFSVIDFKSQFHSFYVNENDIVIAYDIYGRKTGEVCIKVHNEPDYTEILTSFK
jgi:hypothetical protein